MKTLEKFAEWANDPNMVVVMIIFLVILILMVRWVSVRLSKIEDSYDEEFIEYKKKMLF